MKQIIKRNLPLTVKYTVIDKKYIPLIDSIGTCCDNCGKAISNIATVKNEAGDTFYIGFDCLETLLINNGLLSGKDIEEYERTKKMIPKIIRFSKHLKELDELNRFTLSGFCFERPKEYFKDWLTFWLLKDGCRPYNDGKKLKDVDFDFLIETLRVIFTKKQILVK